jgi:hypothetical protein
VDKIVFTTFVQNKGDMNTIFKLVINLPRLLLISVLLVLFFIFEGIMLCVYLVIETPFRYLLRFLEESIRYFIKELS